MAYDGCHKIYFLEDEGRQAEAAEYGYKPFFQSTDIRSLVARSCPLVFVSRWGYSNDDFTHPWNIMQFTEDVFEVCASSRPDTTSEDG